MTTPRGLSSAVIKYSSTEWADDAIQCPVDQLTHDLVYGGRSRLPDSRVQRTGWYRCAKCGERITKDDLKVRTEFA